MVRMEKAAIAVALGMVAVPQLAQAQEFTNIAQNDPGDTAWVLTASLFTLLITLPGLLLYYAGQARAKNALSVGLQIAAITSIVSVLWVMVGYTLAFGDTVGGIIGNGRAWMLTGLTILRDGMSIPESTYVLFQLSLAVIAPALIVGAWVDRARFGWVVAFCAFWSLLVYAPVAHWLWGGGWLGDLGVLDKAGGLIVHTTAGVSALVVALLMGRRLQATASEPTPHSPALMLAGAAMLWVGLLARNGVPSLTATDDASAAMLNTHLAAAVGALVWLLVEKMRRGQSTATGFAMGALAGLVTITPSADLVAPGGAILIGTLGALTCYWISNLVRAKLLIDDPLSVFAINGACGMVGTVLLALFAWQGLGGTGYTDGALIPKALGVQAMGVLVVALYSAFVTAIIAVGVSLFIPMRVSEEEEAEGLDKTSHGESSWHID